MGRTYGRNFSRPDETHTMEKMTWGVIEMDGVTYGYGVADPGWSWESNVKPHVGGDNCQVHHAGFVIAGRLWVRMSDGAEAEYAPGALYVIEPGHIGKAVGDEPLVTLEFSGAREFGQAHAR